MDNLRFDRVINLASRDTKKGSRVVAKIFYRILRKKGFSENQIIDIATNILGCLTESLKGYEEKVEKTKVDEKETGREKKPIRKFVKCRSTYRDHDSAYYDNYI